MRNHHPQSDITVFEMFKKFKMYQNKELGRVTVRIG